MRRISFLAAVYFADAGAWSLGEAMGKTGALSRDSG
jgi:hypothetical protein